MVTDHGKETKEKRKRKAVRQQVEFDVKMTGCSLLSSEREIKGLLSFQ